MSSCCSRTGHVLLHPIQVCSNTVPSSYALELLPTRLWWIRSSSLYASMAYYIYAVVSASVRALMVIGVVLVLTVVVSVLLYSTMLAGVL